MAAKKSAKLPPEAEATPPLLAKKTPRKAAAKKAPSVAAEITPKPSPDTIARAAYLNYRRRTELGLPGDAHDDWHQAERQSTGLA